MGRPGLQVIPRLEIDLQMPHVYRIAGHSQYVVQDTAQIDTSIRLFTRVRIKAVDQGFRKQLARLRGKPMHADSSVQIG